jgi:hypothetical protein
MCEVNDMTEWKLDTPVAFLIFNRPDTTRQVFAEIAKARPSKLLVVGDGPRPNRSGEATRCAAARAVIEQVDWDCEVLTNYSEVNLGCKRRVSSGLDWVFNTVEEAIVLEDDCLPHSSFFRYCEELLKKYKNEERIAQISGVNFQFGRRRSEYSYYFSRYNHIWGWASWRRAWRRYDVSISSWPELRRGEWLETWIGDRRVGEYWRDIFDRVYSGEIDTWDYQWTFACWRRGALTILPEANLISNIGFGSDATHVSSVNEFAHMDLGALQFPLRHPPGIERNSGADAYTDRRHYGIRPLAYRALARLWRVAHGL